MTTAGPRKKMAALAAAALLACGLAGSASGAPAPPEPPRSQPEASAARAPAEWVGRFCTIGRCGPRRADSPISMLAFGAVALAGGLLARRRTATRG